MTTLKSAFKSSQRGELKVCRGAWVRLRRANKSKPAGVRLFEQQQHARTLNSASMQEDELTHTNSQVSGGTRSAVSQGQNQSQSDPGGSPHLS